jgi:hypothetical protein
MTSCKHLKLDRVRLVVVIRGQAYEVDKHFIWSTPPKNASLCSKFIRALYDKQEKHVLPYSIAHEKSPMKIIQSGDMFSVILIDDEYKIGRLQGHVKKITLDPKISSKWSYLAIPAFLAVVGYAMSRRANVRFNPIKKLLRMAPLKSQKLQLEALSPSKEVDSFITNTDVKVLSTFFQMTTQQLQNLDNMIAQLIPIFADHADRIKRILNWTEGQVPDFGHELDRGVYFVQKLPFIPPSKGKLVLNGICQDIREFMTLEKETYTIQIIDDAEIFEIVIYDSFYRERLEKPKELELEWVQNANVLMHYKNNEFVPIAGLLDSTETQRHNLVYSRNLKDEVSGDMLYLAYKSVIEIALSTNSANVLLNPMERESTHQSGISLSAWKRIIDEFHDRPIKVVINVEEKLLPSIATLEIRDEIKYIVETMSAFDSCPIKMNSDTTISVVGQNFVNIQNTYGNYGLYLMDESKVVLTELQRDDVPIDRLTEVEKDMIRSIHKHVEQDFTEKRTRFSHLLDVWTYLQTNTDLGVSHEDEGVKSFEIYGCCYIEINKQGELTKIRYQGIHQDLFTKGYSTNRILENVITKTLLSMSIYTADEIKVYKETICQDPIGHLKKFVAISTPNVAFFDDSGNKLNEYRLLLHQCLFSPSGGFSTVDGLLYSDHPSFATYFAKEVSAIWASKNKMKRFVSDKYFEVLAKTDDYNYISYEDMLQIVDPALHALYVNSTHDELKTFLEKDQIEYEEARSMLDKIISKKYESFRSTAYYFWIGLSKSLQTEIKKDPVATSSSLQENV